MALVAFTALQASDSHPNIIFDRGVNVGRALAAWVGDADGGERK